LIAGKAILVGVSNRRDLCRSEGAAERPKLLDLGE
jgi:hypothetical protein